MLILNVHSRVRIAIYKLEIHRYVSYIINNHQTNKANGRKVVNKEEVETLFNPWRNPWFFKIIRLIKKENKQCKGTANTFVEKSIHKMLRKIQKVVHEITVVNYAINHFIAVVSRIHLKYQC